MSQSHPIPISLINSMYVECRDKGSCCPPAKFDPLSIFPRLPSPIFLTLQTPLFPRPRFSVSWTRLPSPGFLALCGGRPLLPNATSFTPLKSPSEQKTSSPLKTFLFILPPQCLSVPCGTVSSTPSPLHCAFIHIRYTFW